MNIHTLIPLGNRVLIEKVQNNEGTVIQVAKENKDWTPTVKIGDIVLLPSFGGHSVKLGDKTLYLFDECNLLGIIKNILDN
jgi:co-chaperonin GroES (HSP10)